ncbi:MAG: FAD-dependent oxidoreductase [Eubacterium sp.]|nr:FAD-dependent oxidoreductase [Eubacterium sp.]
MTIKYDVAVIGGGGSGLVAAVRAAQLGGKKVVILEKSGRTGGGMVMASTMRTFRSKWQEEKNLPDVTDMYLRKVMQDTYWRLDPELVGNAILATGKFFDWFLDLAGKEAGEKFRIGRYVFDDENGPLGPQMGGPGGVTGGGRFFMDTLREKCKDYGVDILLKHRVKDAEYKDGKISAVIADSPSGEVKVLCDSAIVACGSWINNDEIMKEICPQFLNAKKSIGPSAHMNPNYTGDGFSITKKANVKYDKSNYTLRMMGPMVMSKYVMPPNMGDSPFSIAVNKSSKRYACEPTQPRMGIFDSGLVMMEQPDGAVYIIFDKNTIEAQIKDAKENPKKEDDNIFTPPPLPETLVEAIEDMDNAAQNEADIYKADTIEKLAEEIGLDAFILSETISEYNAGCEAGFDKKCFKESKYLVPINEGPFYAIKAKLGTDGAFGGVLVNPNMLAYREDGSIVDNLYVTGDFASGRFVNMGGVKVQVLNDMSWALAGGFIAGSDVCKRGVKYWHKSTN